VERSIEIKIRGLQDAGRRVANINLSEVARKEWFLKMFLHFQRMAEGILI
jgi:hypothetical protein